MPFTNSFMKPDVQFTAYFEVETTNGTETVPADLINVPAGLNFGEASWAVIDEDCIAFADLADRLKIYVDGEITEIRPRTAWLARLSASGYMDCTDWSAHATEQEAMEYLEEMYGEED